MIYRFGNESTEAFASPGFYWYFEDVLVAVASGLSLKNEIRRFVLSVRVTSGAWHLTTPRCGFQH